MPERVSTVTLISFTSFEPLFAYSAKYTAENTPTGTAIRSVNPVISNVLIIAGIMDTFFEVYSHAKSSGVILGMPFINM